ncbi:helix-turn-helix domain-containing protein [Ensifer sp. ENS02]|uniref:helix-turn-helix domain-containing protein n=1 Tax=Ensifer sp. ENS02 TaxID=2769290 RepID=UPI00177F5C84|nr:helix-turn-helix domain-containing protein [Ensifer sp. ENS02]MBD9524447.1 helix-turn-helix domain-containing protein [Ensifer sp. ENS02]
MAGPSLEQWILDLGLQQVEDPQIGKPIYRKPIDGRVILSAELEGQISSSLREARDRRRLARKKVATLLGLSERVYERYENNVSRLTVGRLVHLCEVLGASPEEILSSPARHLWGETETCAELLLASIEKLRSFDEETLRDVLSLLNHIESQTTIDSNGGEGDGAALAAPSLPSVVDPLQGGAENGNAPV